VERIFVWEGWDRSEWHAESVTVSFGDARMQAMGTQLGVEPLPYALHYQLSVELEGFVTRRLSVSARGAGWSRGVELDHSGDEWVVTSESTGFVDLPEPGGDGAALSDALDIDLQLSPLTNWMPARRFPEGAHDFTMAYVEVPSLRVVPDRQRYTWLGEDLVRYESVDGSFTADIKLDAEGFVISYPAIARRVTDG
jgi:hypothetical protein